MFCLYLSHDAVVRCFSDVKTAVWISTTTGRTIRLDLVILRENSGSVSSVYHKVPDFLQGCIVSDKQSSKHFSTVDCCSALGLVNVAFSLCGS